MTQTREQGATVVNLHQGNDFNPWINYPYITERALRDVIDRAHQQGLKLKLYNTMRELSNRAREIWAMRAWNETYLTGPGGNGASWLREHLVDNYSPAWSNPIPNGDLDAAIKTTGLSRLKFHNLKIY